MKKNSEDSTEAELPCFLLSHHGMPQSATSVVPSELLMGRNIRSAVDFILE